MQLPELDLSPRRACRKRQVRAQRYNDQMKTVQLSELGPVAAEVRKGEVIAIQDGEEVVANLVPVPKTGPVATRIDELVAERKATRGTGELPDWFFTDPLPVSGSGSVLEQLLEDRRSRDW